MARKNSYLHEVKEVKEVKEETRPDYRDKIRRHKLSSVYRFVLVVAVVLVLIAIVYVQYKNHVYTSYDVVSMNEFDSIDNSVTTRLGENILTYSHDGAHCTNAKGEVLWNQTFEMQNILTDTCEDVVAIADYNGRQIYVLDSEKKICEITTTMPIRNITVAGNGRVAVAVADTKITWVNIYDPDGTLVYEGKTTMGQSGYPIALSLSPNGELLGQSFVYVDAGVVKSRVAFYNFGAVGSNMSDYIVSVDVYPEIVIPYIEFLNADTAIAVGEDRLLIYTGSQKPALLAQHLLEEEIQAVYHNESYVGLVLHSDKLDMQNRMDIYGTDSEAKIGTYYFSLDYEDIFFAEDYFVAYNNMECLIQTFEGNNKFEGDFYSSTDLLYPVGKGKSYKFIQVSRDAINTIQLK
ncbi:MAG: hypothetical protein IJ379_07910 [Lachnospiraceae bacterium]|nr:hypothetical protein [Lachnospiraceae bacterium]